MRRLLTACRSLTARRHGVLRRMPAALRALAACRPWIVARRVWLTRPAGPAGRAQGAGARQVGAHRLGERGMATAEYAVGMVAACGFAALLYKILTSSQIRGLVVDIVQRALHLPF